MEQLEVVLISWMLPWGIYRLNGTLSRVDFMAVTMGDIPKRAPPPSYQLCSSPQAILHSETPNSETERSVNLTVGTSLLVNHLHADTLLNFGTSKLRAERMDLLLVTRYH